VPRDLFAPEHTLIDGILLGDAPPEVKGSVYGPHLEFLVGTVLARGVPATTRRAFENEAALEGLAKLGAADIDRLAAAYPTIAHAYAPEQWDRSYGARGLERERFSG
jgi:hypothetical protein